MLARNSAVSCYSSATLLPHNTWGSLDLPQQVARIYYHRNCIGEAAVNTAGGTRKLFQLCKTGELFSAFNRIRQNFNHQALTSLPTRINFSSVAKKVDSQVHCSLLRTLQEVTMTEGGVSTVQAFVLSFTLCTKSQFNPSVLKTSHELLFRKLQRLWQGLTLQEDQKNKIWVGMNYKDTLWADFHFFFYFEYLTNMCIPDFTKLFRHPWVAGVGLLFTKVFVPLHDAPGLRRHLGALAGEDEKPAVTNILIEQMERSPLAGS